MEVQMEYLSRLFIFPLIIFFMVPVDSNTRVHAAGTTLKYDDGTHEGGCSPWSDEVGSEIAVRFTPLSYPVKLEQVQFFVGSAGIPATSFEVRIYDDGNGSSPGDRLDTGGITGVASEGNEWVTVDVSYRNISITDGDFFVSMYWSTAPGGTGADAQFLGHDFSAPIDNRTMVKYGASGAWKARNSESGCYADAMIRAVVGNTDNLMRVKGIPVANIVVDGSLSDWSGISPVYVDVEGDNGSGHTGCDLKHVYAATNAEKDTLYIALEMTELPNEEKETGGQGAMVQYCIAFDDFSIDSYGSGYHDWQIGIDSENNYWVWDLREDRAYDNQANMTWWGKSDNTLTGFRQGEVVEFSLRRSIPRLPESFAMRLYLVLRDGKNTNPDSMNRDLILTFNPSAFTSAINSISTRDDLLAWMGKNITYGWPGDHMTESMSNWIYKSPDEVFFSKRGECASQSAFEAYILNQKGYDCDLLWVNRIHYSDHSVCYWQDASGYRYFENAFYGYEGIHGPFDSIEAIGADIYNKLVQRDGNQDSYTLSDMGNVPYGADWAEFNEKLVPLDNCITIGQDLSIPVQCAEYNGKKYGFTLRYYTHPDGLSGYHWKLDNATLTSGENGSECLSIGSDLSLPMPCAAYGNAKYGFTLKFYSNPHDPSGLYWKMDMGTLVVK